VLAIFALALPALASGAPAGSTLLVSRPPGNGPVPQAFDNLSETPGAISSDDRYVAFASDADGFAAGVNPSVKNVLLRDRQSNTTVLVSRSDGFNGTGGDGASGSPAIAIAPAGVMPTAPTGQPHVLVTFVSEAHNLVDHDSGQTITDGSEELWLRDVTAGTTTLLSRGDGTTAAAANAGGVDRDWPGAIAMTAGGPVVAFFAASSNIAGGAGGLFLRTVLAHKTEVISCTNGDCSGSPTPVAAYHPAIRASGSGIGVAFDTPDKTLTGDSAGHSQVMLAVMNAPGAPGQAAGAPALFVRVSEANGTTTAGNDDSEDPSMSADGQDVGFLSRATNLTSDTVSGTVQQAFDRNVSTEATVLASRGTGATGTIPSHGADSVSVGGSAANHLLIAFDAEAADFGSGSSEQAYVRDLGASTTTAVGRGPGAGGAEGDGFANAPDLSPDGLAVIFTSNSGNLGDGGGNHYPRVHLRTLPPTDVSAGSVELMSRPSGTAPFASVMDKSSLGFPGDVSTGGRFVTFYSASTAFAAGTNANTFEVYVRDTLLGRTILVSRASGANGAIANGDDQEPGGISADGRYVVFSSTATNLSPLATNGQEHVYVRDLRTNATTLVSRTSGPNGTPGNGFSFAYGISADGHAVVMESSSALDPAGVGGVDHLYERNLTSNTTTLVDRENGPQGAIASAGVDGAAVNMDGNRVAWVTRAALAGAPSDGHAHLYVRDLRAGTTTLASRADGSTGVSAAGDAFSPTIDAAGDIVAFATNAHNLGETFFNEQVFARNLTTSHTEVVSRIPSGTSDFPSTAGQPSIDARGDAVAFFAYGTPFGNLGTEQVFVRDLSSGALTLASRANGALGAPGDGNSDGPSIDPTGTCVAFDSDATNLNDGFGSPDFDAVHMRVLGGQCPVPPPVPVLSALKMKPRRVHLRGRHRGASITFVLNVAAKVMLRFDQLRPGRRQGKRCVVARRHGKRCTLAKRRRHVGVSAKQGVNRVRFSAAGLPRGRYRLTATPAGGKPRTITFTIVR
jgi:Tol biopolymer transport system component